MIKRAARIIAAMALAGACSATAAYALGSGGAYYLTFDEFTMTNQESSGISKPSPYDAADIGGNVSRGNITDMSEYAPVEAKRDFNRAEGKVVWELCVNASSAPEGGIIALRSGDTEAIAMKYAGDRLRLVTPDGEVALAGDNGFYGIRAYIDIDAGSFDMQVNGTTAARGVRFLNSVSYLDNFYVKSDDEGIGAFVLDAMRIHKNYLINDWFMTSHKNVPDNWRQIGTGTSLAYLASSIQNDYYSLAINDADFTKEVGVSHKIDTDADEIMLEFQFLAPKKVKEFNASLRSGDKDILKIGFKNLGYGYWSGDEFNSVYTMRENLWYHAMVKLKADGAQLYLNHKLVADKIQYERAKIDEVRFLSGRASTGTVYIDDVMAQAIEPLPADYVPAPQKPEKKNDTVVSIQSCNIWREGTHFGWDSLAPYPERKTYLGYYDEGSSEVRDWETKWMVEHGIDAEIYCWYRQPTSKSEPIKRPRNSFELHDAYFNSEYSDMIKFAIAWENGGAQTTGFEDFAENIVPYWIEQYFKDDRYLVIDNKPVVVFYTYNNLVRDFGSQAGAKQALDYLDSECRKLGFDGAYLLTTTGSANKTLLENIEKVGFDGIYCYSWDINCGDINVQKNGMTAQRDTNTVSVIATVGMGRDDTPWERSPGTFTDPADYEELLKWVRDEYVPKSKKGTIASKMITLDNWNEYGEGHYLAPSPLTGFNYLDAVRNVFTNGAAHDDPVPTEEAKSRFNHLYVQDRRVEKSFRAKQIEKQRTQTDPFEGYTVVKRYDFADGDSTDNYPIAKQIENFKIENGILSGDATDGDPGFYLNDINYPTSAIAGIRVRFKTDTKDAKMQFYYITEQVPSWSEGKSMQQTVGQDGEFVTANLTPSGADSWSGLLTSFRVDPMATTGHFEIDSIEIMGIDTSVVQPFNINGAPQYPLRGLIIRDGTMYVPAAEYAAEFGFKWCNSLDGKSVELLNSDTGARLTLEYGIGAVMQDGETFIALRRVANAAQCEVRWDADTGSVNIITPASAASSDEPDPEGELNFNRDGITAGIASYGNISNLRVAGGSLSATAGTSDPNMRLTFSLDADKYRYCNIRIRNKSLGNTFKVYFTVESDRNFSESKAGEARMTQNDKEYKTYTIDMGANSLWRGRIVDLRIDPTDGVGDFAIDYIRFSDTPGGAEKKPDYGENVISGGIMETRELDFETVGLDAHYSYGDGYIGRYGLLLSPSEGGYIKIPAAVGAGNKYTLTLAAKPRGATAVRVGMYMADGSLDEGKTLELSGDWQSISHSFTPDSSALGIYIMPAAGAVLVDNLRLGETKNQNGAAEEKPRYEMRENPKSGNLRVLIIGNSITQHAKSEAIGWLGDWGMAATSADKDYVHLLTAKIREKSRNAEVKAVNISEFERCFYDFSLFNSSKYDEYADFDADIIICTYGANIKNPTNENDPTFAVKNQFTSEHYAGIADFFNRYGDAKVIAGITPLTSYEVREKILAAAEENGWQKVNMSDLGADEYTAKGSEGAEVFTPDVTQGVLSHPGDLGMEKIYERLWAAVSPMIDEIKR